MTFEIVMVFDAVGFGVAYPRVDFSEKWFLNNISKLRTASFNCSNSVLVENRL